MPSAVSASCGGQLLRFLGPRDRLIFVLLDGSPPVCSVHETMRLLIKEALDKAVVRKD